MAVEQGASLTIIQRGHPTDDPEYVGELRSIRRVWIGDVRGLEWLHDEAEQRLAHGASGWFVVRSERSSMHLGAGGEIATVILELLGAGVAGKVISDLIDYAKEHIRREREKVGLPDSSPDFSAWGEGYEPPLPERVKADLAEVAKIPAERLELVEERKTATLVHSALYRDTETGFEYEIEIGRDEATMRRR
jgi:hypothetical protein